MFGVFLRPTSFKVFHVWCFPVIVRHLSFLYCSRLGRLQNQAFEVILTHRCTRDFLNLTENHLHRNAILIKSGDCSNSMIILFFYSIYIKNILKNFDICEKQKMKVNIFELENSVLLFKQQCLKSI